MYKHLPCVIECPLMASNIIALKSYAGLMNEKGCILIKVLSENKNIYLLMIHIGLVLLGYSGKIKVTYNL